MKGQVIFGWNKYFKDSSKLSKQNNQSFVQIPTSRLKERIKQLCEQYGVKFTETKESYTSKSSFIASEHYISSLEGVGCSALQFTASQVSFFDCYVYTKMLA